MTAVRRRVVLAGAAAALVLGAVALRPLLPQPPGGPPAPSVEPAPTAPDGPLRTVVDVVFTDPGAGYAAVRECTGPFACAWLLATTGDGRAWQRVPAPVPEEVEVVDVVALPDRVLLLAGTDPYGSFASPGPDGSATGVATTDGGATWTRVDTVPDEGVAVVPEGAVLRDGCRDAACTIVDPVAVLPADGRHVALRTLPAQAAPGPAGTLVLTGILPGTGGPAVATSRDGARSWTVAGLGAGDPAWTASAGGSGGALHAAVSRYDRAGDPLGVELWTSGDGGASWLPGPADLPASDVAVGPAGRLVLRTAAGGLLVSDDGGRTVDPVDLPDPVLEVRGTGGGWVAVTGAGWLRSTDGTTWAPVDPAGS